MEAPQVPASTRSGGGDGGDVADAAVIKELIVDMYQPSSRGATRAALDAHFSGAAAVRVAGIGAVAGRDALYRLLRAWQAAFDDRVEVLDVAVHGRRALARVRHNLQPRLLNAALPLGFGGAPHAAAAAAGRGGGAGGGGGFTVPGWLKRAATLPLIVSVEIVFEDTPRGKRIVRWSEDVSLYSLAYALPYGEAWWHAAVEPACGAALAGAGAAWDVVAPRLDAALAEYAGWKTGLADV